LLSGIALSSCETDRLSARDGAESTIEFNPRRDLYRRGVKLLTINKEGRKS
jgi:hypothetical protein